MMRLALLALVGVLAVTGPAVAGTGDDPEAVDRAADGRVPAPCNDLRAAWVEADGAGHLTFGFTVESCPKPPVTGSEWWGGTFAIGDERYYMHAVYDASVGYQFWSGRLKPGPGLEPAEHVQASYQYEGGSPARLRLPYPPDVANLSAGGTLRFESLQSGVVQGWNQELPTIWDEARASREFTFTPARAADAPGRADAAAPVAGSEAQPTRGAADDAPPGATPGTRAAPAAGPTALLGVVAALAAAGARPRSGERAQVEAHETRPV